MSIIGTGYAGRIDPLTSFLQEVTDSQEVTVA